MKPLLFLAIFFAILNTAHGQIVNTAVMDSTSMNHQGKVTIGGYIDTYYSYDFNKPADGNRPYFVSMGRHNEVNVNLAYIDIKYSSTRLRARFVPGFGSYMNSNYAAEEGTLKNIVEANAGLKIFANKNIWLDFGVFGSPFTNESAISKDHLAYTRSFAPEYVPYYMSGAKLTLPLSQKVNLYLYALNGWQQIKDQNSNKAFSTQIEYRPNNSWLINWNTYVGKESSASEPTFVGQRLFTDAYFIYTKNRWAMTGDVYVGSQEQAGGKAVWWNANLIAQYSLTEKLSVVSRIEYFDDEKSVQIVPITSVEGFSAYGSSLGINYRVAENFMFRTEGRVFFSDDEVYFRDGQNTTTSSMLTTNFTVWF
ncbi:porin [Algoriphagus sp. A40]|uniref:porin n=1 Tax=Algoriphagus sp. A40 TaxID=1945863 RepID=UPI00143B6CC2|nr:porin [Algoriphagus sp. A40]